jgi:acyl carrier protein
MVIAVSGCHSRTEHAQPHGDLNKVSSNDQPATANPPNASDVYERVRKVVIKQLGVDPKKVTQSARFFDDLGADSLDGVELVMGFEEEFDIEIPDDSAEKMHTVGDAVEIIGQQLKARHH